MVELCLKALDQFDESIISAVNVDLDQTYDSASHQTMKEVKGLEDRLYGLDQIMNGAKRLVQEQSDISQGFLKNQSRATNLRDNSILPDLCASHKKQLLVLLRNHEKLRDIKKKCRLAKEELSVNLHTRLRWVMFVEKKICDVDGKIMLHHENLKRLHKRIDILRQIRDCPQLYGKLIVEVICRRHFSTHFIKWATAVAAECNSLYSTETCRRKKIIDQLGKHFLQVLFPGLDELPPQYTMTAPESFDQPLPNISLSDMQNIRESLPELFDHLQSNILDSVKIPTTLVAASSLSSNPAFPSVLVSSLAGDKVHLNRSNTSENNSLSVEQQIDPEDLSISKKDKMEKYTVEMKTQGVECEFVDGRLISVLHHQQPLLAESPTEMLQDFTQVSVLDLHGLPADSTHSEAQAKPPQSPQCDDSSQEFTSADFYIDESLHTSISTSAAKIAQFGKEVVLDRQPEMEHLKMQLLSLSENCSKKTNFCHQLVDVIQKFVKDFRLKTTELQNLFVESRDNVQCSWFQNVSLINDKLIEVDRKIKEESMNNVQRLMQEHDNNRIMYEEKLCAIDADNEKYKSELQKIKNEFSKFQEVSADEKNVLEKTLTDQQDVFAREKSEIIKRHSLELAVEIDRIQTDLQQIITTKDLENGKLLKIIAEKAKLLQDREAVVNSKIDQLTELHRVDKTELDNRLKEEFKNQLQCDIQANVDRLQEEYDRKVCTLEQEFSLKLEKEVERLESEMAYSLSCTLQKQKDEFENEEREKLLSKYEREKMLHIEKLKTELQAAHDIEVTGSQEKFLMEKNALMSKLQENSCFDSAEIISQTEILAENVCTKQEFDSEISTLHDNFEAIKAVAIEEAVSQCTLQFQEKIDKLSNSYETKIAELQSESMKRSLTAEKQILFNEAVTKVSQERERDQENFKMREMELLTQQQTLADELSALTLEKETLAKDNQWLKLKLEQQNRHYGEHDDLFQTDEAAASYMSDSGTCHQSLIKTGDVTPGTVHDKFAELQNMLRVKDTEIERLQNKMSLSMTATAPRSSVDKVSVTTCNVGDIVLVCRNEKHDQYVIFTVGNLLYFLHPDSLDALSLRHEQGEQRRSWVLAEVIDKEYCQARKANNRFKVPAGTKFYRVKAKPWMRDCGISPRERSGSSGTASESV